MKPDNLRYRAGVFALSMMLAGAASCGAWFGGSPALAQAATPPVVVVVDAQKILRDAKAAKSARGALTQQRQKFEQELEQQRKELQQAEAELKKQQTILAPEALEQKRRDLEKRIVELRRETEERQAMLSGAFSQAMRGLTTEMNKTLAAIMKERDITIAFPRSAVLVFDQKLDITKDVLAALDQRVPAVKIEFDKPQPKPQTKPQPKTSE